MGAILPLFDMLLLCFRFFLRILDRNIFVMVRRQDRTNILGLVDSDC